jgi:hypothetical protein
VVIAGLALHGALIGLHPYLFGVSVIWSAAPAGHVESSTLLYMPPLEQCIRGHHTDSGFSGV